ncbi:MAG: peptidyl-prolyl cis-trans isomerase [Bdellovibrionota bacterium]
MLIPAWLTKRLFKFSLCFFYITCLVGLSSCNFISNRILNKPVAQVENIQLSTQSFSKELALKLKDLDALSAKDSKIIAVFKEQILNDFLVSAFVNLWFTENNLSLSPDEINKEVAAIVSTYPSDAIFRELLSEAGLSYSDWVAKIAQGLKKKRVLEIITKGAAPISENELLSFYTNNRTKFEQADSLLLSHILVADANEAEIVRKLVAKQNFTDVAKKYSTAYNLESKDLYGWIERGFSTEFEKSFKLRIGEIFGPITLSDGIHVFKLVEKRPAKILSFAEARARVLSEISALRETAKFAEWLDVQIKKYRVKKNLSVIDSIRVETR